MVGYFKTDFIVGIFCPRKFTVTAKDARIQIRVLHFLTSGLNDGTIAPGLIPRAVSSVRAWNDIREGWAKTGGAVSA